MSNFAPLSWDLQFKLSDHGADLNRSIALFNQLDSSIKRTNASLSQMHRSFRGLGSIKGLSGSGQNMLSGPMTAAKSIGGDGLSSMSSMFGTAARAASSYGAAILAAGYATKFFYDKLDDLTDKMVASFVERQSSIRSYTLLLGSAKEAEKQYFSEAALAQKTELTQTQVRGFSSRLITAGFRGDKLERARLNIADLVTMRPQHLREASANQLGELYSKVQGLGYIQEGLLNRTASRFVNTKLLKEEIAKQLKIKPKDVGNALRDRKVTSEAFFNALQFASNRQLGISKTGEYSTAAAGSLGGLLSNIDEAKENLFRSIDPEAVKNIELYKKSLTDVTEAMTAGTKIGEDLRYALEDMADVGIGLKSVAEEAKVGFLEGFGEQYRKTMEELTGGNKDSLDSMKQLGGYLKTFANYAGKGVGYAMARVIENAKTLGERLSKIPYYFDVAIVAIKNFGLDIKDGFVLIIDKISTFFTGLGNAATGLYYIYKGATSFNMSDIDKGREMLFGAKFFTDDQSGLLSERYEVETNQLQKGNFARFKKEEESAEDPKNKIPMKEGDIDFGSGGGRRGRKSKEWGTMISWDYSKPLPVIPITGSSAGFIGIRNDATPSSFKIANNPVVPNVTIQKIDIIIDGSNQSPQDITNEIATQLSQTMARLLRSPSAGVI